MLRKRIIFTLIYSDGYFMQSRNFRLQKVGNIDWIEKNYNLRKIAFSLDELIVLDASINKNILDFSKILNRLVEDVFIPISAGGGVRSIEDARVLFENGADKILLNTAVYEDPELVGNLINKYGSQSIVASIDYHKGRVFIDNGNRKTNMEIVEYIGYIESLDFGEIYLNSIERDGTGFGYDVDLMKFISEIASIPLIIAGGAGNSDHLMEGISIDKVSAVATANLFNFIGDGLPNARKKILNNGINLARWKQ
jgi:cyclase